MNGNYIIADAGGTSTQWVLCDSAGKVLESRDLSGINATVFSAEQVAEAVAEASDIIPQADTVYFYGAGCKGDTNITKVADAIAVWNIDAKSIVDSDLAGAAKALAGDSSGIVCILGTGSNSCAVSNGEIVMNTPPLGYLAGDEGSGASLGRRLLREVLRGNIGNSEILSEIESFAGGPLVEIIPRLYASTAPNRYLSHFAPIMSKYIDVPEIQEYVTDEFKQFFKNCIFPYIAQGFTSIGFIGSVAKAFEPTLRALSAHFGLEFSCAIKSPIEGLIEYHKNRL